MHVSQDWKDGVLIPLHKNDKKICDNYRGIALLSIPGRQRALPGDLQEASDHH